VIVEFDNRFRHAADSWMDFKGVYSRNLDAVFQWLGGRTLGDELYAIRAVQLFYLLVGPWIDKIRARKDDYNVPGTSWITSSGDNTRTNEIADQLAAKAREDQRLHEQARNKREARDYEDLAICLISMVGKCAICYIRKHTGREVGIYHAVENCKDEKRDLVVAEMARLRNVKFERGLCCKSCFVPLELCNEGRYLMKDGKEKCLYEGIVHAAVAAMIVVSPDIVVEKMYVWM
jgi:hypothetical protein